MIVSMTGYGRVYDIFSDKKVVVDVRALNSKNLDLNLRVPPVFKEKEPDIRKMFSKEGVRGKIDVNIVVEMTSEETGSSLNEVLIKNYALALKRISESIGMNDANIMDAVMRMPDVTTVVEATEEEELNMVVNLCERAIEKLIIFREKEGVATQKDFELRLRIITEKLNLVELQAPTRIEKIRLRIESLLEKNIDKQVIDNNRFEQELIYYLEKLDISEEIMRLKSHCQLFEQEILSEKKQKGKKLGFIAQEMGREINTIGSKANDKDIQALVVDMKNELEKIKEQVLNVL